MKIRETVETMLRDNYGLFAKSEKEITDTDRLIDDLNVDDLTVIGVVNDLENEFGIVFTTDEINHLKKDGTFGELVKFTENKVREKEIKKRSEELGQEFNESIKRTSEELAKIIVDETINSPEFQAEMKRIRRRQRICTVVGITVIGLAVYGLVSLFKS